MSTDATNTSPTAAAPALDTSALPDDPNVLKQMIAELIRALRSERRDKAELQQRLDALLRHRQRLEPTNPNQPLLFPEEAAPEPTPTTDETKTSRRGKCKPHGRRKPSRELRREERRYELTAAERLCPGCGTERQEIGVETTEQLDYKPAEVFVIEHQRVKYACKCCEGQVAIAPKPAQPIDKGLPGPGLLAQLAVDKDGGHSPTVPRGRSHSWRSSLMESAFAPAVPGLPPGSGRPLLFVVEGRHDVEFLRRISQMLHRTHNCPTWPSSRARAG